MANIQTLDRLDQKLLAELDANARAPLSQVAKGIRLGSDLVHYRFERLIERGVVLRTSAVVDFYRAGKTLYKVYLRLRNQTGQYKAIEKHLNRSVDLHWFARTHGKWDLIFSFYAEHSRTAYLQMTSVLEPYAEHILETAVLTVVSRVRFSGTFGIKRGRARTTIGESPDSVELDPLEIKLLKSLEQDARIPTTHLAEHLGTTQAIIDYRRKRLEQLGLITGYRLHIDSPRLGLSLYKLCLRLRSYKQTVLNAIEKFCERSPFGVCVIHQLGEWLIELEVEVSDHSELHQIVDDLREELGEDLLSIDPLLVKDCYYLNRTE
jgi:DNA-binding Lrp family transcriptional regulator